MDDLIDELPVEKRHLSKLIIICGRFGRRVGSGPGVLSACMQTSTSFGRTSTLNHTKCGAGQLISWLNNNLLR